MDLSIANALFAILGLAVASGAAVDLTKIGSRGGIAVSAFASIQRAVHRLFAHAIGEKSAIDPASVERELLEMLRANWISAIALDKQKEHAKSILNLYLSPDLAKSFAIATRVDGHVLAAAAANKYTGAALTSEQEAVLARFDLALAAILEQGFQTANQKYRNWCHVLAGVFSVVFSVLGGLVISPDVLTFFHTGYFWLSVLFGVLATPLAPVARDILVNALSVIYKLAETLKK